MPDDERKIITIPFHQDTLYAMKDGDVTRVAVSLICDRLGIDWEAQRQRIRRNPILDTCASIMKVQIPGDDQARDVTTLPIEFLNGWLFGIQASRVAEHHRPMVLTYQRECYAVLHQHFFASRTEAPKGPTYAAVQAMIKAEVAEAVRLVKGAVWGMTKNQTAHIDGRHNRHDDDLNTIGVTVLDTQEAIDRADMRSIGVILADRNIQTDRKFSNKCSVSLRDFCAERGLLTARSPETRAHVFPSVAVGSWLQDRGNALIKIRAGEAKAAAKAKADRKSGQTSMVFPFQKKPS
jgi:hypothetical protein